MQRLNVTYRITILLALLSTMPVFLLGLDKPNKETLAELVRQRIEVCEQVAVSCSLHLRRQDVLAARGQLQQFVKNSKYAASVRLERFDGLLILEIGSHASNWSLEKDHPSTLDNVRVPLLRDGRKWGTMEVAFRKEIAASHGWWFAAKLFLLTAFLNALTFFMLLKRKLSVLDPGSAVPKRVRNTLDTIVGGVVVLDNVNRIVLANEAFASSCGSEPSELLGRSLDSFTWRVSGDAPFPWIEAVATQKRISSATVYLKLDENDELCFVVNATPLFDAKEKLAGAMVSFEDVTVLETQRRSLVQTLENLEISKEQIKQQNEKLITLASRDALTGAFNRRALFEKLDEFWKQSIETGQPLVCIMLDVDHFKKLNDNHGHSIGDQVLREVARVVTDTVGTSGVAGRYGGEEFCVVLPNTPVEQGFDLAESIRRNIATELATPYAVTTSVGVSTSTTGVTGFQGILDQADKALYRAKHGGRNNVRLWHASMDIVEAPQKKVERKPLPMLSEHSAISYHAVTSLHAALAYRDADTAIHSQRVAEMSVSLGRGLMSISELYVLEIAALLHDIGKIGVPDSVLLKPTRLTEEEWKIMEAHARIGVEIIEASFDSPELADIVRWHHCRFDGARQSSEMPMGQEIPLGARIVCICDAFDAMVSNRVYRQGRSAEEAFAELKRCAGSQFDPELVERFVRLQLGWRPDSYFGGSDTVDKLAITIGQLTERMIQCFEQRQGPALCDVLEHLSRVAGANDLPVVDRLAREMAETVKQEKSDDWKDLLPILQSLVELCLTVQRAHIRDVGWRPKHLEISIQRTFDVNGLLAAE